MILTITFILSFLVALNFALLYFSCNKTKKTQKEIREPRVINKPITTPKLPSHLAPTGS